MPDYTLKAAQNDKDALIALGVLLGVLRIDEGAVVAALPGWAWHEVGEIYRPTGSTLVETMSDGTTITYPEQAPILGPDGVPAWHANLRAPEGASLMAMAQEQAVTSPEVAAALADVARWSVADADGNPVPPQHPAVAWFD